MINRCIQFLQLIRFPNLVITALALWMHWYFLLKLPLNQEGWTVDFDAASLMFLCLAFAMVMGSGFIINDIYDMEIDAINKGSRRIVGQYIGVRQAWVAFWALLIIAASISLILAYRFDKLKYIWIYPVAAGLLIIYSIWLKKTTLVGNLLIAGLCGAVLLIPLIAESTSVARIPGDIRQIVYKNFTICFLVAGLLTLSREIVKDIEDVPGDMAAGAKTLPISKGMEFSKVVVYILLTIILVLLFLRVGNTPPLGVSLASILAGFIFPLIFVISSIYRARQFKEFRRISTYLKLTMVAGMILLPLLLYYQYSWNG